ncbi:MAG: PP2C family protein-serine/threonine phosphatase, partial [Anaerolineae bacterium]
MNVSGNNSHPMSSQPTTTEDPPKIEIWGATNVGQQREGNEDSIFPDSENGTFYTPKPETLARKGHLLIVADGVGGAQAGSEASQWAIRRAVERYYELPGNDLAADLQEAVSHANASLTQYLQSTGTDEAGSTMSAAVIHGRTLYIANVGDSRVYLLRDGKIYQQTRDHTRTQQKVDQGLIRPEDADLDPDKNILTRSLGAVASVPVDIFPPVQLEPGDRVLICSDGLYDMLNDAEIARLATNDAPRRAAQKLIAAANKQGGYDNISVILAEVEGKSAGAVAAGLGSLGAMWSRFTSQQRTIVIALAALLALVVLGGGATIAAWNVLGLGGDGNETPIPAEMTETLTPTQTEAEAGTGGGESTATATPTQSSDATGEGTKATSTPRPTFT